MVYRAVILVNTELGAEDSTASELRKIPGVSAANEVYGIYDILAVLEGGTVGDIKLTYQKIRRLGGVRSSSRFMVADFYRRMPDGWEKVEDVKNPILELSKTA